MSVSRPLVAFVLASLAASAPAQILCAVENDGNGYEDLTSTGNAYFAIKFVAPATYSVNRIEIFTGEISATSALDIWTHDASLDQPSTMMTSDAFTIALPDSWQGTNLATPAQLVVNQTYWIVWHAVLGAQASLDQPGSQNGAQWCVSVNAGASWIGPAQSTDRQWKYRLFGDCCASTAVYCTAGTTSNGCLASINSVGVASASAGSGFFVQTTAVEGQKQGLFFYGLSGALAQPWGTSSSFLCVKPPTQRTGTQSSGGTIGTCNGSFQLDWNLYIASNPGALGTPYLGGETVWIQTWFRDPPSPKTTHLSDALQFSVCP